MTRRTSRPRSNPDLLVAIDPAARGFAWSVFVEAVLRAAGVGKRPEDIPAPRGALWLMEDPQDYTRFGVAHDDLDRLRATLRKLAKRAAELDGVVEYVTPHTWKGNVPKRVHHRRMEACLKEDDLPLAPVGSPGYDHNVHDAVALGMTRLGRIGRGGARR